jgi:hypothetical protein
MKNRLLVFALLMMASVTCQAQLFTFQADTIASVWQYIGERNDKKYDLKNGKLRLYGDIYALNEQGHPFTCACQTVPDSLFTFETKMTMMDVDNADEGGILLYRSPQAYVQCYMNNNRSDVRLRLRLQLYTQQVVLENLSIGLGHQDLWLRIAPGKDSPSYEFSYSFDGKQYQHVGNVDYRLLSNIVTQSDAKLQAGIYCFVGSGRYNAGYPYADFEYVDIQ